MLIYQKLIYQFMSHDAATSSLLDIRDVMFSYNSKKKILNGVNLTVNPGEIIGISGENGTGKSTLLKIIVGLLKPKSGQVSPHGRIGYSPQDILLFDNLTVMENFEIFGSGLNLKKSEIRKQANEIMNQLNFSQYAGELVRNLSGGTMQKLNFGVSLLGEPDVFVLDEPYQGLDYVSFQTFWEIQFNLREKGKSIVIVSHMIEDTSKFTKSYHLINKRLQGCDRKDCPVCCQ